MRARSRHHSQDRGITLLVFALSVSALFASAALVMGGSNGYSASRNSQTAADAAALAATNALRAVWQDMTLDPSTDTTATVNDTAVSVAEENGADTGSVTCELVTAAYAVTRSEADVLGDCDGTYEDAMTDHGTPVAGGVRVSVQETRDVPFGGIIGAETITAGSTATATVQPVRGGFRAPFMLCAFGEDHGINLLARRPGHGPPLQDQSGGDRDRVPPVGERQRVREQELRRQRLARTGQQRHHLPGAVRSRRRRRLVGHRHGLSRRPHPATARRPDGCDWATDEDVDNAAGCRLPLPLCVGEVGDGTNVRFNCVRMATFLITYVGDGESEGSCVSVNKKVVCGKLEADAGTTISGQGTLDEVDPFELAVVRLVE